MDIFFLVVVVVGGAIFLSIVPSFMTFLYLIFFTYDVVDNNSPS